jgi:hypothetical protein
MTQVIVAVAVGIGGIALGAWLSRRNEKRATTDRLLVEALNDLVSAIADVANNVPNAQARYASAVSRVGLHGPPSVVAAFCRFQDQANTGTLEGRKRLISAVQQARLALRHETVDDDDLATLFFGPSPRNIEDDTPAQPSA